MNKISILTVSFLLLVFMSNREAQAQASYLNQLYVGFGSIAAANAANANGAAQNLTATGNLGIWESGVYGNINDFNSQWLGLGGAPFPGANVYGMRIQWKKDLAIANLRGGPGDNDQRDYVFQWGTNSQNRIKFEFVGNAATQATTREVMTMLSSGRVGVNTNNPIAQFDTRGTNAFDIVGYFRGGYIGNYGIADGNASFRLGSVGIASGASFFNAGVYGFSSTINANSWAGYFNGDVFVSGNFVNISDQRLKRDIQKENSALTKVLQLKPATYTFNNTEKNLSKGTKLQHGFIAQELEQVYPELVRTVRAPELDANGAPTGKQTAKEYKAVDYVSLISILTAAIQDQQAQINAMGVRVTRQTELIESQEAELETLRQAAGIEESLGLDQDAELFQNTPNPFSRDSEIRFYLPQSSSQATLFVYDMQGSQIKRYDISQRGESAVRIAGSELDAGMYIYSLIVDGKEVDTKRMILSR